jgi:hypothetical protein
VRLQNTKQLFAYWNRLRGSRSAPERGEVEPSDIREVLGDTFILEIAPQLRTISFRLAGTRLCAAYGKELKGFGYLGIWAEENNFDIAKAVASVYRDMQPVVLTYTSETATGRSTEYEAMLLPLAPAADGNSRILGIATPVRPPFWLGAEPLENNRLRTLRLVDVKTPPIATQLPGAGGEEHVGPRRFAHLTVFDGGRT